MKAKTQDLKTVDLKALVIFYAICVGVEILGNHFTQLSVSTWYAGLNQSPLTPAGFWFGIVWTALYILMAVAAWKAWHQTGVWGSRALRWWGIQLFSGLIWSIVFFGNQCISCGLAMIMLSWIATLVTIAQFGKVNKDAGLLMVPQLGWLTFATYLNYYIFANN